jgi:hypothetical protein
VALSADQKALLQLLLERGQSYDDLAGLLNVDQAEVRARARAALTELGGADPDRHVGLTDYLLGQADPIDRADAVRHLKDHPDDLALATEIAQKARLIAPQAELPRLPGEERQPRPRRGGRPLASRMPVPRRLRERQEGPQGAPSGPGEAPVARRPWETWSRRQTQLFVGLASGAVLLVMVVLAVAGVFSSDGDESSASPTGTTTTAQSSEPQGFPITNLQDDQINSGTFQSRFAIPRAFQALLPRVQAVYVTLAKEKVVTQAIKTAVSSRQPIIPVEGKTAFTGIVNAAKAQKNVIPIPLRAQGGVSGSGAAALGVAKGNQAFFDLKLTGLDQAPKDSAYIVWFVLA